MLMIKTKVVVLQSTRIKKGLSTRQLAIKAGVNPVTIFKIENKGVNPVPSTASKICNALGVSFDELFELKEPIILNA